MAKSKAQSPRPRLAISNLQSAIRNSQLAICIVLGFLARLAPMGRYVTPDEPAWVYRSVCFADALAASDWSAIPSTGHPGVTTMWLGAAGVTMQRLLDPAGSIVQLEWIRRLAWLAPENGEAFRHLAFFLPLGRVAVALVTTLGLLGLYFLARSLFGSRVAFLATGLMALDPFLVGHSGLLHTDALLTTFCALSAVSLLGAVRGTSRFWAWALASGIAGGLAMLTKSTGIFLAAFALLVAAVACVTHRLRLLQSLILVTVWALVSALLYCALFPTMWAAPVETVRDLIQAPTYHATAALMPTFFAGRTTLYHGPEFYVVALPIRLSPVVLIGLVLSVRTFVRHRSLRSDIGYLWLFAFGYILLLVLNVKKYDRYLLPIFPPLALAAALSFSTSSRLRSTLLPIALQLALLLPFAAHPLTYANPLLGGPHVAARVLPVDWGEGMGIAARWLNRLPDADQLTVAAVNIPSFASLFAGRTVPLDRAPLADYLVRDSTQPATSNRQPVYTVTLGFLNHAFVLTNTAPFEQAAYLATHAGPDDLILLDADTPPLLHRYEGQGTVLSAASLPNEAAVAEWLAGQTEEHSTIWLVASPSASPITAAHLRRQVEAIATPVATATVASATITQYATRHLQPAIHPSPFHAAFGGQLLLVDGTLPQAISWPDPLQAVLRWQAVDVPPTDYRAVVALRDENGHAWSTTDLLVLNRVTFPTSAWIAGQWADVRYELRLPPGIPPGRYTVEVGLYDAATGAGLGAVQPDGAFQGTRVVMGEATVVPPTVAPDSAALEVRQRLDLPVGPLTLLGLEPPPAQVLSGDHLSLSLFWQADATPNADFQVRLRLISSNGKIGLERTIPLSLYPTSCWRPGDRFESRYDLHVLPDLSPGHYWLALNLLDGEGNPLWEADRAVVAAEVLPRERFFELPEIPHSLGLTFGDGIHLRGYRLDRTQAAPGETLSLTLYWQAEGPADRNYTLFVHLLGPGVLPHGQVDLTPGGGLAPTSSWAAGQVIVDEIALPVAADAPPGTYRIAVGFYDAAYGDRLPVTDAGGHSLPDEQAVLPVEIAIAGGRQ